MSDYANGSNVANPALITGARVQYTANDVMRWAKAGKVFTAGLGLEATDTDSVTTEADTTPTYALVSPANSAVFVVPIEVRLALSNDGGGLSTFDISVTKAASQCATKLVCSGTTLNIQNHLAIGPHTPQSAALLTVTASALLTTDYIAIAHQHAVDAALTTGLPLPGAGLEWVVPLLQRFYILTQGAALLVHTYTASSAGKTVPSITWAELGETDF